MIIKAIKRKLLKNILSLLVMVVVLLAISEILKLDILPNKYLFPFIAGECLLFIIAFILYNIRKKWCVILGLILYLLAIIGNILGYYYLNRTNQYIDENFAQKTYTIKTSYYIVASKNNPANSLNDLKSNSVINYYKYSRSIQNALKQLGHFKYQSINTIIESIKEIQNTNDFLLIGKADYDYLIEDTEVKVIKEEDYKIIYELIVEEEIETNQETNDSYNIYINGYDFSGVRRDYNLIATINTKTRKVVLTSIPRDYYIEVPGYNIADTLMFMGALDVEISKEALEKLFSTKIDYTININTNSLVDIVDSLGGLGFCSDMSFTTTHSLRNDYKDYLGRKLYVKKGCYSYNGIEILTIARERLAFKGGDRIRQKNCRQILINILKKLASITTLTNYDETLNSLSGLYTTDMNDKAIKQLIKTALEDSNFEIIEQSVDGKDGKGIGGLGTGDAWIITPDMNTVNAASAKIEEVLSGK